MLTTKGDDDLNNRLKMLRKDVLRLSQEEFAKSIGMSKGAISQFENGTYVPTSQTIMLICREFGVSESWLRTGEGEMFVEISKEDQLIKWAGDVFRDRDDAFRRRFVQMLMQLPPEGWKLLEWMTNKLMEEVQKKSPDAEPDSDLDIDQEVAAYRAELEAEKKAAEGSSPSGTGKENAG